MNEQNWQDQLGEPKFEEGLLHQKLFFKKNLMKMSLSKLHNDVQPLEYSTEQQMSILCDMCGKLFQHKSTYNRHIEHSHKDLSKFECKYCEKSFSRLDNIRRHVKNIHNDFLGQPFKRTLPTLTVSPPPTKIKKSQSTPYYSEPQTSQSYVYQQTL